MRYAPLSSGLVFAAICLLTAACGSSDDDKGDATGGQANSSGGSTSRGGATSQAGFNAGGGNPGMGFGCPATKPEAGTACMRRGGGNNACAFDDGGCSCVDDLWVCYTDADCPGSVPANDSACTIQGMSCAYDQGNCNCDVEDGWECTSPCPTAVPDDGASCLRSPQQECRYLNGAPVQGGGMQGGGMQGGQADTTCACQDGAFSCFSAEDCPASAPASASACEFIGLECPYTDRQCECNDDGWSCQTACPATVPTDTTTCERPANQTCGYNAGALVQGGGMQGGGMQGGGMTDTTCACSNGVFSCFSAADCPATRPAEMEACTTPGLSCPFDTESCRCRTSTSQWTCNAQGMGPGGGGGAGNFGGGGMSQGGGAQQ